MSVCGTLFRCTGRLGHPEPAQFTLSGGSFSAPAERVRELRQRVRPDGRLLSLHRLTGAIRTALAGSPLTGGSFLCTG